MPLDPLEDECKTSCHACYGSIIQFSCLLSSDHTSITFASSNPASLLIYIWIWGELGQKGELQIRSRKFSLFHPNEFNINFPYLMPSMPYKSNCENLLSTQDKISPNIVNRTSSRQVMRIRKKFNLGDH